MLDPIIQTDFSGGMNLLMESFNIAGNEYGLAYNVRNRKTTLDPILAPVEDTDIPVGNKQGIYAFDQYLVSFVGGRAYYKNVVTNGAWTQVNDLAMNGSVDYIYLQAVPASRVNFERKLKVANQIVGTSLDDAVYTTSSTVLGTPAAAVIQDGINLPWIIQPDGTARKCKTFQQWTKTNREYVPIMRGMAYKDGKLYGISKDGKKLYHSVSGRPLDFVVNVDTSGNKGGDADTTAYAVGFDELTCIVTLPSGELLLGSTNKLSPITIDYTKTIFAEPTFTNPRELAAGIVNQFSFLNVLSEDGLNDSYFIDLDGLRSFNAVQLEQNEGRNTDFSLKIGEALVPKQTITACINFQNYSFFSIKTLYSNENLIGVWDNKTHRWVCFDDYGIGTIKQFAVANQGAAPYIYAITTSNKLYKLFGGTTTLAPTVRLASRTSGSSDVQISLEKLGITLVGATTSGMLSAIEYVNGYQSKTLRCPLSGLLAENKTFNFAGMSKQTWQSQAELTWNNNAKLALVETQMQEQTFNIQQAGRTLNGS